MTHNDAAPSRKAPQKARRGRLFTPFILALILAAGWSYGWFWLRGQAEQRMDATSASFKARGYDLSWRERTFSGFPFRMNVTLADARIAEPSGWALRVPELKGEAEVYDLTHWVMVATHGVVLTRPDAGDVVIAGQALRASFSHPQERPPRISVEGANLTFTAAPNAKPFPLLSAANMQLHLRAGPDDQGAILFKADGARADFVGLLGRIVQDKQASMVLDARLTRVSALHGHSWADAVRAWTAAGGAMTLQDSQVLAGDAEMKGRTGALTVDQNGRLEGALDVSIKERPDLSKPIKTREQMLAAAAEAMGQEPVIKANLKFGDGRTHLGSLDTGPSPRIF